MNNEFERMKKLLSDAGLTFEDGGITNAEIYSYAVGLDIVRNAIQQAFDKIFINIDTNEDMSNYCELLNIDDEGKTNSELKSEIYKRLGAEYGQYTCTGFDEAFSKVGSGEYEISDDGIVFKNVDSKDLKRLGNFVAGYIFPFVKASCDGEGLTFDSWDEWSQSFYRYDNMNLTFDIIDTLRSDLIE
jgi:hypothetical protein